LVVASLLALPASAQAESAVAGGMEWYTQARSLQDQHAYDAALQAYRRAIELNFQPAGAYLRIAQIVAAQGDVALALDSLEKALALNPAAVSLLPQIGGIPQLADNSRFEKIMADADAARHPCKARPEAAQFDFWLGDWIVTDTRDRIIGENHVTRDLEGCVLRESWTDGYGNRGTSVNFYDPATRLWHQVWTSDGGTITHYQGEFADGAMHFTAIGFGDADGKSHFRRMTFTPNGDGSVRQLIEDSEDGEVWAATFDGTYRKQKPAGSAIEKPSAQ
jgi:tetratricopeptide (TPR) repeat protein